MREENTGQDIKESGGNEENEIQDEVGKIAEVSEETGKESEDSSLDIDGDGVPSDNRVGDRQPEEIEQPEEAEQSDETKQPDKAEETEALNAKVPDAFDEIRAEEDKLNRKRRKKRGLIVTFSVIAVLLAVYFGFAAFFMNHFYFGTKINGKDFSAKTAEDAQKHFSSQADGYELKLKSIDGSEYIVGGADIDLVYKPGKEIKSALKQQNPFLWIISFFNKKDEKVTIDVMYNKDKLAQKVAGFAFMDAENQMPSANATPTFDGTQYVITPEVIGTQVNQEGLNEVLNEAVTTFMPELDMKEKECYTFPAYTKDSPEVAAARDNLNKYAAASITYTLGDTPEVVDKTLIASWLSVDENMGVTFNKDAVGAYVDDLCSRYNTIGSTRSITTPSGKAAEVSGGTYGFKINRNEEYNTLIANIEAGEVVAREPVYSQSGASRGANDWGSTYVEVDLSSQQMWYVQDGNAVFQTAVVTGLPRDGRATPQGVYVIMERLRNKTLRGKKMPDGTYEYETPVDYWMRVTGNGIGFHDATWQPSFGGQLYKTRGSHGCINMSYSDASALYGMIATGTPVIMHY